MNTLRFLALFLLTTRALKTVPVSTSSSSASLVNIYFVYVSMCANWIVPCTSWSVVTINKLVPPYDAKIGQVLDEHCELRYRQAYNRSNVPCDAFKYRILNTTYTLNHSRQVYQKGATIRTDFWQRKKFIDPSASIQSLLQKDAKQNAWIILAPILILRHG